MKVLIYGINYSPELIGIGKYSGEMGAWLARTGAEVKVITAPPCYPNWEVADGYSARRYQRNIVDDVEIFRCPLYVPKKPSFLSRLIHLLSFAFTSFWILLRQVTWRPDVVLVVEPSFFCAPGALFFGAVTGAKTVLHIQDYEIDALFGLGMVRGGPILRLAHAVERFVMKRFDRVSTISYSMMNHALAKGVSQDQILFFPNWVDTDFVTPDFVGRAYRDEWGFSAAQRLVLYSGNLGKKQGMELVLDVAEFFSCDENVQFVIVGQGAHRKVLEQKARDKQLDNVHFKDLVPYEDLPALLAMADIQLVVQKKGVADVVLPSKLTSILSAGGHVLITAEKETELGLLVEKCPGIAQRVEPENLDAFVQGLQCLLAQDVKVANTVARDYAVNQLGRDAILSRFYRELQALSSPASAGTEA